MERNLISFYFINHLRALFFSLGAWLQKPFANTLTILAIGLVLSFPLILFALMLNLEWLAHTWENKPTLSLYLKSTASEKDVETLLQKIKTHSEIVKVHYISPEAGLNELKQLSEFKEALNLLPKNPLPGVIEMTFNFTATSNQINRLLAEFKDIPDVEASQLDSTWIQRLLGWLTIGKRMIAGLFAFFGLGIILIIANIMRLNVEAHRQEILVLRLTGASLAFIRRPFLYSGILYGFFSAITAWLLVCGFLFWLHKPVSQLALTYASAWRLSYLPFSNVLALFSMCMLLGLIGAWSTLSFYLSQPETRPFSKQLGF